MTGWGSRGLRGDQPLVPRPRRSASQGARGDGFHSVGSGVPSPHPSSSPPVTSSRRRGAAVPFPVAAGRTPNEEGERPAERLQPPSRPPPPRLWEGARGLGALQSHPRGGKASAGRPVCQGPGVRQARRPSRTAEVTAEPSGEGFSPSKGDSGPGGAVGSYTGLFWCQQGCFTQLTGKKPKQLITQPKKTSLLNSLG